MIYYQPIAYGPYKSGLNGTTQVISQKIFLDKAKAEAYLPDFKKKCTETPKEDINSFRDIDPKHIKIYIQELSLEE